MREVKFSDLQKTKPAKPSHLKRLPKVKLKPKEQKQEAPRWEKLKRTRT
jgi:hypothetical protein